MAPFFPQPNIRALTAYIMRMLVGTGSVWGAWNLTKGFDDVIAPETQIKASSEASQNSSHGTLWRQALQLKLGPGHYLWLRKFVLVNTEGSNFLTCRSIVVGVWGWVTKATPKEDKPEKLAAILFPCLTMNLLRLVVTLYMEIRWTPLSKVPNPLLAETCVQGF